MDTIDSLRKRLAESEDDVATLRLELGTGLLKPPTDPQLVEVNTYLKQRMDQANAVIDQLNQQVADLQERRRFILASETRLLDQNAKLVKQLEEAVAERDDKGRELLAAQMSRHLVIEENHVLRKQLAGINVQNKRTLDVTDGRSVSRDTSDDKSVFADD